MRLHRHRSQIRANVTPLGRHGIDVNEVVAELTQIGPSENDFTTHELERERERKLLAFR